MAEDSNKRPVGVDGVHLNLSTLAVLKLGVLPEPAAAAARSHLSRCASCAALLEQSQAGLGDLTTSSDQVVLGPRGPLTSPDSLYVPDTDSDQLPGPIGPYTPLERLGEGAMGTVYSAYHRDLDRKVALKLIRAHVDDPTSRARLLREAQAMARLDHPNVVAIHDFGQHGDRFYLVMDRVEGQTLKAWLAEQPRDWRAVVAAFRQAGEGLAAAHRAGMVHRDFKPSNVLIGTDGRVRVGDFGLARSVASGPEMVEALDQRARALAAVDASRSSMSNVVTLAGAIVGTPRFMAPEQFRGQPGDARSDQFAFCVSLYEALYKEHPFAESIARAESNAVLSPPPGTQVPSWLRRVLLRGLAFKPEDRFSTMEALLRALADDPGVRRRRAPTLVIASLVLVATGALVVVWALQRPSLADCGNNHLTDFWNPKAEAALRDSFVATGKSSARAEADRVLASIDSNVATWQKAHGAVCLSARTAPTGDEHPLLELACLGRQREQLQALVEVLQQADETVVGAAAGTLEVLLPPSRCADPRVLSTLPRLPSDPRRRAEAERLRLEITHATMTSKAGKPTAAKAALTPIIEATRAAGDKSLEAEALYAMGTNQTFLGEETAAEQTLGAAEQLAEVANLDAVATQAAVALVFNARDSGKLPAAHQWLSRAQVMLERIGGDPLIEADVERAASLLAEADGEADDQIAHARRAVSLTAEALGPEHPLALNQLSVLGIALVDNGQDEEAEKILTTAMTKLRERLGPNAASPSLLLALAHAEAGLGHFDVAAGEVSDAQRLVNSSFSKDSTWLPYILDAWARLRLAEGKLDQGLASAKEAEAEARRVHEVDDQWYAQYLGTQGRLLEREGRYAEAEGVLARAAALYAKVEGPGAYDLTLVDAELGAVAIGQKHPLEALALLERAEVLGAKRQRYQPGDHAALRFNVARALVAAHREHARAGDLAKEARAELAQFPWLGAQLAEVDAWLKKNGFDLPAR